MRRSFQIVAGSPTDGDNWTQPDVGPHRSQLTSRNSISSRSDRNRAEHAHLGSRRARGPAADPIAARLSGTRLLLAQGDDALADAGYYVVAPDQRGYGRTTGWDDRFNGDLQSFTISRIAIDAFALVRALGMKAVHTVVGHDFGSPIAAWCGLTRPDVFRSCVMMSAPYRPAPPVGSTRLGTPKFVGGLADLERPRKHYVWYYSTPEANDDMRNCPQGISDFLRVPREERRLVGQ